MASLRLFNQLAIEGIVQTVVLRLRATPSHVARHRRVVEHRGQVDTLGFPVVDVFALHQAVHAANHLIDFSEAEFRHDSPQILGNVEQEIDHMLGLALELLAKFRVLRRHAHRTGVQVAFPHHDAAHRNERSGGKPKLLRTEQGRDRNVPAGLKFSVHLQAHAAAQVVHHQDLLSLRESELPGDAGVPDGTDG